MSGDELCWLTLTELSRMIRTREVSPVEVTNAVLDRIDRIDKKINSFITVCRTEALKQARISESDIASGQWRGPLHGIPISLKDIFHVHGIPNTAASKFMADTISENDSAATELLRQAGAILIGKCNLHEFAYGATSSSSHFGPVKNPWDPSRISGGSSGGSAAAVAAGLGHASLGTDTGGSVRVPAALCGVVGLKPTFGRISRYGVFPLSSTLDHVGIFVRTVEDVAYLLQVLSGSDSRDPYSANEPVPDFVSEMNDNLRGMRVGILESAFEGAHQEVSALAQTAVEILEDAGAIISKVHLESLDDAREAAYITLFCEAASVHTERLAEQPDYFFPDIRERIERGQAMSVVSYIRALETRRTVRLEVSSLFENIDVLVTPMLPITAPRIGDETTTIGGQQIPVPAAAVANTREWNLLGNPALSVPCGFTREQLPVALQIVGRPMEESRVLCVGAAYQNRVSWPLKRPTL